MGRVTNTMKVIGKVRGKIDPGYDLASNNMEDIRENSSSIYSLMCNSFAFGYIQGMKATKAELKG